MGWLLLILSLICAVASFGCLILASVYRHRKPNRYASATWGWGAAFAVFFVIGIASFLIVSESRYLKNEALVYAAREGDLNKVKTLVAEGADVNATLDDGEGTPLIEASNKGHTVVVKYLIAHGANASKSY